MRKYLVFIIVAVFITGVYNLYGDSAPVEFKRGDVFTRQKMIFVRIAAELPSKKSIEVVHADHKYANRVNTPLLKNVETQGLIELDKFLDKGWKVVSITPLNTQPKNNVLVVSILIEAASKVIK